MTEPGASRSVSLPRFSRSGEGARQTFASLGHRNYRLWFTGQTFSLVGTWMQTTALGFLIFELTRSPAYLGYVGFASGVPIWLFSLFGGVVSDRMPRRNLLVITQTSMMILAFILAALTFMGVVQPWQIVVLAFLSGVANAFDAPARQAFVVELVERSDLANAIALNSTMVNLGSAIGPALAGVAYALFGPGWCFTINAVSFLAVIVALLMMRLQRQPRRIGRGSTFDDLREGLRYVVSHSTIRVLIVIATVSTLFGLSFATLLPAWAVAILGGDSTTNGFLQSARGLGALIGALTIASLSRFNFKGRLLTIGSFLLPVSLLIWAAIRWLPLSLVLLVSVGAGSMFVINLANILVQLHVTDELRGRVMGVYTLALFGTMPIGSLFFGGGAQITSEPITVAFGAAALAVLAVFLWLRVPELRRLA